jgi:hypothetical protein
MFPHSTFIPPSLFSIRAPMRFIRTMSCHTVRALAVVLTSSQKLFDLLGLRWKRLRRHFIHKRSEESRENALRLELAVRGPVPVASFESPVSAPLTLHAGCLAISVALIIA